MDALAEGAGQSLSGVVGRLPGFKPSVARGLPGAIRACLTADPASFSHTLQGHNEFASGS